MNKAPNLIKLHKVLKDDWPETFNGRYYKKARPIGFFGFLERLQLAFGVFTGKWDALEWEDGQ